MIRQVTVAAGRRVGAAVTEALDDPSTSVVILSPAHQATVPTDRLSELFQPEFRVAAVVPRIGRPDGHLIEAGVVIGDAGPVSRHLLVGGEALEATAADVVGTEFPFVAFRRELLAGQVLDPGAVAEDIVSAVMTNATDGGLRIVYEPTWRVATSDPRSVTVEPRARPRATPQILVVAASLPPYSLRSDDHFITSVIDDLAHVVGGSVLTVAVLDGFRSEARSDSLRLQGIRVVTGPIDWRQWLAERWGSFDHVFVSSMALNSSIREWLTDTQPQAVRVMCADALPFRSIEALAPVTPTDEVDGLRYFSDVVAARIREWLDQFNAVICARASDAEYVDSVASGRTVVRVRPHVEQRPSAPLTGRSGLVMFANAGYNTCFGNEEATIDTLRTVVPQIGGSAHGLRVTVVSDGPSPLLARTIRESGAEVVAVPHAGEVVAQARVVLALHEWGTGGGQAILAALGAGTPFIASPTAAEDLELGPLRSSSVFADPADIRFRLRRLLHDDRYWVEIQAAVSEMTREFAPEHRQTEMRRLLAATGRDANKGGPDFPLLPPEVVASRPALYESPSIRPGSRKRPSVGPAELTESSAIIGDERYRLWHERHAATPAVRRLMQRAAGELSYRPRISVLMPVHDPDPAVFAEAVRSVREQIYPEWQLCLADDGSERPEIVAAIAGLEADPQIVVVRLPDAAGISEATNAALRIATGEFVAFMDHDDVLKPHALVQVARWLEADPGLDVIYTDEDKIDADGQLAEPHLKPDWSPDLLMSANYVSHLTVIRRSLVEECGGLRKRFDGSQDYDLLLRVTEHTDRVAHIPEPLYSWRAVPGSAAADAEAKPYAARAARDALAEAVRRRGRTATVEATPFPTFYRTRYEVPGQPRVSIVIPTRDGLELLEPCVRSIFERSTYANYEILIVDNQSTDGATLGFLAAAPVKVVRYPYRFNYSRQINLAAVSTESDVLLFLNNDTEVISPDWIEALLEHAMRPEVGAVGGRLYYSDGRVQHEGILIGSGGGWAWNVDHGGYFARGDLVRNASAVTGACTMIRSSVYARLGGNDERLRVAYNDVDICLRVRQAGLQVVYTPYAELFHHEGATRQGFEHGEDGPRFGDHWQILESTDPYHSPLFLNDHVATAFLLEL